MNTIKDNAVYRSNIAHELTTITSLRDLGPFQSKKSLKLTVTAPRAVARSISCIIFDQ